MTTKRPSQAKRAQLCFGEFFREAVHQASLSCRMTHSTLRYIRKIIYNVELSGKHNDILIVFDHRSNFLFVFCDCTGVPKVTSESNHRARFKRTACIRSITPPGLICDFLVLAYFYIY